MFIEKNSLSTNFIIMESLYERLLDKNFSSSQDAIEFCREICLEYGFNIKHEINENGNIYVYCSYEDNSTAVNQTTSLRKRPSSLKDTGCPWRIVLNENELSEWVFRKSSHSNTLEHNHILSSSNDSSTWPNEVYDKISQLARQKNMQPDEIRETIKMQFPEITWNDGRFYNFLSQERKKIQQKGITERVQKLIMASTRLCSVVAANEEWANCVEADLIKLLESYGQLTRISNQQLESMVDIELDLIQSEIDKPRRQQKPEDSDFMISKKRKSMLSHKDGHVYQRDIQIMSIPSCNLYVRSQPIRSISEPATQSRRAVSDFNNTNNNTVQHHSHMAPFGVGSLFSLTSPVSSPSSTSSIQQRIDYGNAFHRSSNSNNEMLQSPPIPDSSMMISPTFGTTSGGHSGNTSNNAGNIGGGSGGSGGGSHHHHNSHHHHHHSSTNYNTQNMYPMQTAYPTYHPTAGGSTNFNTSGNTGDMNFAFDSNASAYQHLSPSPAPMIIHRSQTVPVSTTAGANTSPERITGYSNNSINYYSSPIMRDTPTSSIQQRIMLQQEYEHHQRHLQQMENTAVGGNTGGNNNTTGGGGNSNVHLPIIRTNATMLSSTANHILQQHQTNQPNLNSNPSQTWS